MKISLLQAALIGIFYYISWSPILTYVSFFTWNRPLVAGFVTGIILGQPVQGAIIGATINLIYIGFISAGGAQVGDPSFAGYVGTAIAIASNMDAKSAMAIAVPLGAIASILWIAKMTVDTFFVHMADKKAEEGDLKAVAFINMVPCQVFLFLLSFIPTTLVVYYGPNAVDGLLQLMGPNVLHVFEVIGGILPALGIAMNLKLIGNSFTMPFFVLGLLLTVYFNLDIITVAILGCIAAFVIIQLKHPEDDAYKA